MKIEEGLEPTYHDDYVDAMAYWVAGEEAKLFNDYVLLHVKKKPWWLPVFVYNWLLGKLLVVNRFER